MKSRSRRTYVPRTVYKSTAPIGGRCGRPHLCKSKRVKKRGRFGAMMSHPRRCSTRAFRKAARRNEGLEVAQRGPRNYRLTFQILFPTKIINRQSLLKSVKETNNYFSSCNKFTRLFDSAVIWNDAPEQRPLVGQNSTSYAINKKKASGILQREDFLLN